MPCSSGCSYSQPLGCTDRDKVLDHIEFVLLVCNISFVCQNRENSNTVGVGVHACILCAGCKLNQGF